MAKAKRKAAPAEDVLSAEELEAATAAAEAAENIEDIDVEAAVAEVEADEAKKETYAKSGKTSKSKAKGKTSKATPKEAKAARPRMSLETHKASEIITSRLGESGHTQFQLVQGKAPQPATLKKTMAGVLEVVDTLDKKTREKAVNLFTSLNDGKAPSVYTVNAIRFLEAQGSITLKSLTDHFLGMGYKIGTARRQAGEMIALLPNVGVGTREAVRGAPVEFNKDSEIARRVLELAVPASK